MTFRASKVRQKRKEVIAAGRPLIASAAMQEQYAKAIKAMIRAMYQDYRQGIEHMMQSDSVQAVYAADAAAKDFKSFFQRMQAKWANFFNTEAANVALKFAIGVDKHSFVSTESSLKAVGMQEPKDIPRTEWADTMQLYVQNNVNLIKTVGSQFHDKIERAVWNSLTAPEGTEQGGYGIYGAIQDIMGKEFKRAELIARDQNAKLYSVLNNARMEQNGLKKFKWLHSSAGKTPRQCHIDWNDEIFLTKGGPNELYRADGTRVTVGGNVGKADIGKPGFPINCRCRAVPVIDFE